jgi:hypothetical protein
LKWTWNEENVFTSSYVFISSLGLTPYYNMVFLIVKMGGVDVNIINGSQRSLTFIRTWTFFLIVLKNLRLNDYITTFLLCSRYWFLTTNKINLHIYWTKRYWLNVQYVVSVYMSDLFETRQYYYMRRMNVSEVYVEL